MISLLIQLIPIALLILGAVIAAGQFPIEIPRPVPAGGFLIGVGLALSSVENLFTGTVTIEHEDIGTSETYKGFAARLWATAMILLGLLVMIASGIEWLFPESVLNWVRTPSGIGVSLILVGLIGMMWTVVHLIGPVRPSNPTVWTRLGRLPDLIFSSLGFLIAAAIFAAGIVQLTMPELTAAWYMEWQSISSP